MAATQEPRPPLEQLEALLTQAMAGRPRQLNWGQPQLMSQSLERVRDALGGRRAMDKGQRIARGLMAFRIQGSNTDFVHLKYACQGLALPMDWESRQLLADEAQVQRLLQRVLDFRHDRRRFAACYQGLLASFQRAMETEFPAGSAIARNRELLRQFLQQAQDEPPAARHPARTPDPTLIRP